MFKWIGRKQLKDCYTKSKMFIDRYPQQKQNFANLFTYGLEEILSSADVQDFGDDESYFQSRFTELHERLTEEEFKRLHLQVFNYNLSLKKQYGVNTETLANDFLASFLLSMMMTQPKQGQKQLDAMLIGPDGEIYSVYSSFASDLIKLEREDSCNAH